MNLRFAAAAAAALFALHAYAQQHTATLETERLTLSVDTNTGAATLHDREAGLTWTQHAAPPLITAQAPLEVSLGAAGAAEARLTATDHGLAVEVAVRDDETVYAPADQERAWLSDSVEIWLGEAQVFLMLADAEGGVTLRSNDLYESAGGEALSFRETGDGYEAACLLPWKAFVPIERAGGGRPESALLAVAVNFSRAPGQRDRQDAWPPGFRAGDPWSEAAVRLTDPLAADGPDTFPLARPCQVAERGTAALTFETELPAFDGVTARMLPARITYETGPGPRDITASYEAEQASPFLEILVPHYFTPPMEDPRLIFTNASGMLLPLRKDHPDFRRYFFHNAINVYSTQGLNNACFGLLDGATDRALLTIFDTPHLAACRHVDDRKDGAEFIGTQVRWLSDVGEFGKTRRLTFHAAEGGYVEAAKRYRRHLRDKGIAKTLQEKRDDNPDVARAAGAPVFWLGGPPEDVRAIVAMMQDDGIGKAIVNLAGAHLYDIFGMTDLDRQTPALVEFVKDQGYLAARYDQFRDTYPPIEGGPLHHQIRTQLFETGGAQDRYGRWQPGFLRARVMHPAIAIDAAREDLQRLPGAYGYNASFIDCAGYAAMRENMAWNPERPAGLAPTFDAYSGMLKTAEDLGMVVGTEAGNDWVLPWASWLEGGMTLIYFAYGYPGWLYQIMPPLYSHEMERTYRIPFYALAVGDCANVTWRWEDGFDRYPQHWQDKNLWTVLYGGSPMFFLNRNAYMAQRERVRATYGYVCKAAQRVAGSEMVSHRFLTEDCEVQETRWANGKGVVVNFGRGDHKLPGGLAAPARGYVTFEETDAGRAYGEPAPPPMDFDYRVEEFGAVTEDFEAGHSRYFQLPTLFGPYLPLQKSGVSSDAEAVVDGAFSAVARNANSRNEWSNEFIYSNPHTLPLLPGHRYEASFDYKALACEEGNRMYCVARVLGRTPDFVEHAVWYPEPGDTGRIELAFTAPQEGVTRLVWGMQGKAALAIDNITVRDLGAAGE